MSHDDDAGEDLLAGVDLHKWQPPPAPASQRSTVVLRALAPAARAPKRRGFVWTVAAIVVANAAIAAILAIVIGRAAPPQQVVTVQPAGAPTDAQVRELLRQIDEQRRELERRLAELDELRTLANELAEKLRRFEERDKPDRRAPSPTPAPVAPSVHDAISASNGRPESLDRQAISTGVAAVKVHVMACGDRVPAKGKVKVKVVVGPEGNVTNVWIESTPDAALGACVAGAFRKARFAKTWHGGSFSYPFVF